MCLTGRQLTAVRDLRAIGRNAPKPMDDRNQLDVIDYFALALVHGLLLIAFFRLTQNDALDPAAPKPRRPKRGQPDVETARTAIEANDAS